MSGIIDDKSESYRKKIKSEIEKVVAPRGKWDFSRKFLVIENDELKAKNFSFFDFLFRNKPSSLEEIATFCAERGIEDDALKAQYATYFGKRVKELGKRAPVSSKKNIETASKIAQSFTKSQLASSSNHLQKLAAESVKNAQWTEATIFLQRLPANTPDEKEFRNFIENSIWREQIDEFFAALTKDKHTGELSLVFQRLVHESPWDTRTQELLRNYIPKALVVDPSGSSLQPLFGKDLSDEKIHFLNLLFNDLVQRSPKPLVEPLVTVSRIMQKYEKLIDKAATYNKTLSQVWSTAYFIEVIVAKASHVLKERYSSEETLGLNIVREGASELQVVWQESLLKNRVVRVLSKMQEPEKIFMRTHMHTKVAHDAATAHQRILQALKPEKLPECISLLKELEIPALTELGSEIVKVLKESEGNPQIHVYLSELLSRVMGSSQSHEILSIEEAKRKIGQLLFILDSKTALSQILWSDFPSASQALSTHVEAIFKTAQVDYHPAAKTCKRVTIFTGSVNAMYENRYALKIVDLITRPDGTINQGILDEAHKLLLTGSSSFENTVRTALTQFQESSRLQTLLLNVKVPEKGSVGEKIARTTLGLGSDVEVTSAHVRKCVLAATFSYWRQREYGSCHTTAMAMTVKDSALEWVVEEFAELMNKGALTRMINGKQVSFLGIAKTTPYFLHKPFATKNRDLFLQQVHTIPSIQRAFSCMQATERTVQDVIDRLAERNQRVTLFTILEQLKWRLPKDTREAQFLEALWEVGATLDMPLLRVWENSVMSMQSAPLTAPHMETRQRNAFSEALVDTFKELAKKSVFAERSEKNQALKCSVADLTSEPFSAVGKLRLFAEPPDDPKKTHACFALYYEESSNVFTRITEDEACGRIVKKLFNELFRATPTLGDKKIAEVFQEYFKRALSAHKCKVLDQDRVWNFGLHSYEMLPLISSYLRAEEVPTSLINIDFKETQNALKNTLFWAANAREILGREDVDSTVPAQAPKHVFRMTPNHPSMVLPSDENYATWIHKKMAEMRGVMARTSLDTIGTMVDVLAVYLLKDSKTITREELHKKLQEKLLEKCAELKEDVVQMPLHRLATLLVKVAEEMNGGDALPDTVLQAVDTACLEGIYKTNPGLAKKVLVHFADTNYGVENSLASEPEHYCFAINPRTLEWQVVSASEKGENIKFRSFTDMQIINEITQLKQPLSQKQLFIMRKQVRENFLSLKNNFYKKAEALLAISVEKKEKIRELIRAPSSLSALQKVSAQNPEFSPLTEFIQAKRDYQKALNHLCIQQNPPVDQLLQEIFMTHFEVVSPLTELLDASPRAFYEKLGAYL